MHQHLFSYTISTLALCCLPTADASVPVLSQDAQPWTASAWTATHMAPTYPNLWRIVISSHSSLALALDFYTNTIPLTKATTQPHVTTNINTINPLAQARTPLLANNINNTTNANNSTNAINSTNANDVNDAAYAPASNPAYAPVLVSASALTLTSASTPASAPAIQWPLHRNLSPLASAILVALNSSGPYTISQLRALNSISTLNQLNQLHQLDQIHQLNKYSALHRASRSTPDDAFSFFSSLNTLDNLANLSHVATLSNRGDTPFNTQPPDGSPPQQNLMLSSGTQALSHLTAKLISPRTPQAQTQTSTQEQIQAQPQPKPQIQAQAQILPPFQAQDLAQTLANQQPSALQVKVLTQVQAQAEVTVLTQMRVVPEPLSPELSQELSQEPSQDLAQDLVQDLNQDLTQINENAVDLQEVTAKTDGAEDGVEDKLTLGAIQDEERVKEKIDAKRQGQSQAPWEQVSAWFKQYQTS